MRWLIDKARAQLTRVEQTRAAGHYPYFRALESGGLRTSIAGHRLINFSSNDYLGLTTHPDTLAAAHAAIDRFACGLSASRVQATTIMHVALEERLAAFFGFERALVTTTGYQAVTGLILTLADRETTLVIDSLAHASIVDGALFATAQPGRRPELRFFNHNSPAGLQRVLATRQRPRALVLVEGIYSVDGDLAPLRELLAVCDRHDAVLIVDDAHGSGTIGTGGRGALSKAGVEDGSALVVTSLSKSFGAIGGVVLGPAAVVDLVKHLARPFLFTASLPAPIVASAMATLGLLEVDGSLMVRELHEKSEYMRTRLSQRGFDLGMSETHIMPIVIRDEPACIRLHHLLYARGFYLVPFVYPGVRRGEERLRLNATRGHSYSEIDALVDTLAECRELDREASTCQAASS